eukprot:GHVS01082010.1.p1 GENE.GHVS01082010.1~~GHVS01082010.1.p1  ORF type:complete len:518 (+),score=69.07 GHVS01082010.1:625-2178(+)
MSVSSQSQSLSLSFPKLPYHYGSPMLAATSLHPACPSPCFHVAELPDHREAKSVGTSLGLHERASVPCSSRHVVIRTPEGGGNKGCVGAVTFLEDGPSEWWSNLQVGGRLSTASNSSGSSGSPTCGYSAGPTTPVTTTGESMGDLRTPHNSLDSPTLSPSTARTPGAPPPLRAATVTPTTSKSTTSAPPLAWPLTPSTDVSRGSVSSWRGVPPTSSAPAKETCRPVAPELKDSAKMLYKTTMCPWHSRGRCFAGDRCNYAHTEHERRHKPNLRETRLCQTFMRKGKCEIVDCSFAHGYERLRTTVGTEETPSCAGKGGRGRVVEKDGSWSSKCVRPSESLCSQSAATTAAGVPLKGPTPCLCVGSGGGGSGGRDRTVAVDPCFFGVNQGADRREATHSRAPADCPDYLVWDQWLSSIARRDGVHTAAKQMEAVHKRQHELESPEETKQVAERRTTAGQRETNARGDNCDNVGLKQSCAVSSHETAGGLISGVPRYIAFFKFFTFEDLQKASPTAYYD